jgi:hypothetical protein
MGNILSAVARDNGWDGFRPVATPPENRKGAKAAKRRKKSAKRIRGKR